MEFLDYITTGSTLSLDYGPGHLLGWHQAVLLERKLANCV